MRREYIIKDISFNRHIYNQLDTLQEERKGIKLFITIEDGSQLCYPIFEKEYNSTTKKEIEKYLKCKYYRYYITFYFNY